MSTTQQQMSILAKEGHRYYEKIAELETRLAANEAILDLLRQQRQQAIDECKRLQAACEMWKARANCATALIASELVDDLGESQ